MARHETAERRDLRETRPGPPLPDGIEHLESLGRFIDNLLGDARMRRRAHRELAEVFARSEEPPAPREEEIRG